MACSAAMLKGMSFAFIYGFASVNDSWVEAKRYIYMMLLKVGDRGCNGSVSWHYVVAATVCACVRRSASINGRNRVGYMGKERDWFGDHTVDF